MFLIKIHYTTFIYILLCFYLQWYKETLLLFSLIMIHETSHMFIAYLLHYEIEGMIIYPFGAFLKINNYGCQTIIKDLMVAIAGICSHLFLLMVTPLFTHYFGHHMSHFYIQFNIMIMTFNLLPIYPLDGFKIGHCLLSYCFDLLKVYHIMQHISLFALGIVILCSFEYSSIIVYLFLFYQQYLYQKNYYYDYLRIRMHRIVNQKLKVKIHTDQKFYLNRQNYYLVNGQILDEKTFIKSRNFVDKDIFKC